LDVVLAKKRRGVQVLLRKELSCDEGRPWTVKGERCLKKLFEGGFSLRQVAVKMGKSVESVRRKMFKLGLVEQEQMKTFVLVLLACLSQFRGGFKCGFLSSELPSGCCLCYRM